MLRSKTPDPQAQLPIPLGRPLAPSTDRFPDDLPLLQLAPGTPWTLKSAYEGTSILGGTGSGKSSSTGAMIARAFCRAGLGGIVLCAKPGEADLWIKYARETGREKSVVVFDSSGRHRFNFLDYAARRSEVFDARSVVDLFSAIMEAASGGESSGEDAMWHNLSKELLTHTVAVLYSAWGHVSLDDVMLLLDTAPKTTQETEDQKWLTTSFCFKSLYQMATAPAVAIAEHDVKAHTEFFRSRWARRHDKIRTSIEATFSSAAYPFQTGLLHQLFCCDSTIFPELAHEGAIIIIDLPVKTFRAAGTLAQHVWKYLFQKATEERKDLRGDQVRPVFLWADECQFFTSSYDREFQSTARSSKACTVYITQNLPTYYAAMRSMNARDIVDSLLGSLQTKVFHSNQCAVTNQWASNVVGKDYVWLDSYGTSQGRSTNEGTNEGYSAGGGSGWSSSGSSGGNSPQSSFSGNSSWNVNRGTNRGTGTSDGTSRNLSQQLQDTLLPSVFPSLRKGGQRQPPEMIFMQTGRTFPSNGGATWIRLQVPQE